MLTRLKVALCLQPWHRAPPHPCIRTTTAGVSTGVGAVPVSSLPVPRPVLSATPQAPSNWPSCLKTQVSALRSSREPRNSGSPATLSVAPSKTPTPTGWSDVPTASWRRVPLRSSGLPFRRPIQCRWRPSALERRRSQTSATSDGVLSSRGRR